ncbi:hypothetical protein SAMN04488105_1069 [Salipiger thiooxidans]|uniref:Uncharacterized protein n=1 Tax=Salipiger thiooxidans TaxID=282683 RepID=A0A1G7EQB3_9RHOB|nr:hypothetical protein SAMN04488105_1069 [Salipiger thiooxidans]
MSMAEMAAVRSEEGGMGAVWTMSDEGAGRLSPVRDGATPEGFRSAGAFGAGRGAR